MLWDCVSLLDDAARTRITELGGISAICLSHPHFCAANVEFADSFDARILIPRADQQSVQRPSRRIELFDEQADAVTDRFVASIRLPAGQQPWPDWVHAVAAGLRSQLIERRSIGQRDADERLRAVTWGIIAMAAFAAIYELTPSAARHRLVRAEFASSPDPQPGAPARTRLPGGRRCT